MDTGTDEDTFKCRIKNGERPNYRQRYRHECKDSYGRHSRTVP